VLLVRELKLALGCKRCGYVEDPDRLHFHHPDPAVKTREVSYMVRWSTARLIEEVAKCDVLCLDCHVFDHHPDVAKPVISLRVDPDLLAWADGYAESRGASRTALFDAALRSLRDDAGRGPIDLPEKKGGPPTGPVRTASRAGRTPVEVRSPKRPPWTPPARQAKLNQAKHGGKS
jgi:hypothetical protein